ncbi:hypothetical protein [Streptomyces sp. NBC_00483]|uniref:hypothetical protein n=1 Tax=Streptomyces sp. NBC_00483 TaxID=2975756 RepID=UPI002E178AE1
MTVRISFVGGPADGRTYEMPDETPQPLYLFPVSPPLAELFNASAEPEPTKHAEYESLRDGGWPRRADDGAYLYGHRAAPVTPEARRAVDEARHAAQAAEERRTAETDAAWREIRKERPHYPEDWRDLWRP